MKIQHWEPFTAFTSLERERHSLLERLGARPWLEGFGWKPDIDMFLHDNVLVVQAELPGVDPATDLDVIVDHNVLRIRGERSSVTEDREADRVLTERRFGSFERNTMLPRGVDARGVKATFDNGLLTVRIPLPEGAQGDPESIHIDVETR